MGSEVGLAGSPRTMSALGLLAGRLMAGELLCSPPFVIWLMLSVLKL